MTSSVYWIHQPQHTNMFVDGYIGVSNNIKYRWNCHAKRPSNVHLKNAIAKYGWDNLVKEIIVIADEDYCLDIELKLRPTDKIGWNVVAGGGKPPILYGNTSRIGKESPMKGKKHSLETIERIRNTKTGVPSKKKGVFLTEEQRKNLSIKVRKNPWKCPHCNKIGYNLGSGNRWHFNNCKHKESR